MTHNALILDGSFCRICHLSIWNKIRPNNRNNIDLLVQIVAVSSQHVFVCSCCCVYSKHNFKSINIPANAEIIESLSPMIGEEYFVRRTEAELRHVSTIKMFWFLLFIELYHFSLDFCAKEKIKRFYRQLTQLCLPIWFVECRFLAEFHFLNIKILINVDQNTSNKSRFLVAQHVAGRGWRKKGKFQSQLNETGNFMTRLKSHPIRD